MSEARNTTRVNRALRLLIRLTFITALGLVLSLLSPFVGGHVGYGCVKAASHPGASDWASDWAGQELDYVGLPIGWLNVTRHKDCWTAPDRVTGLGIDWLGFALNEVVCLAGIKFVTWLYARLRRARSHGELRKGWAAN